MTFVIEAVQGIVNEEVINKLNAEKMLEVAEKATNIKSVETKTNDEKTSSVKKKSTSKNK
jgi:hypothetical protein